MVGSEHLKHGTATLTPPFLLVRTVQSGFTWYLTRTFCAREDRIFLWRGIRLVRAVCLSTVAWPERCGHPTLSGTNSSSPQDERASCFWSAPHLKGARSSTVSWALALGEPSDSELRAAYIRSGTGALRVPCVVTGVYLLICVRSSKIIKKKHRLHESVGQGSSA